MLTYQFESILLLCLQTSNDATYELRKNKENIRAETIHRINHELIEY